MGPDADAAAQHHPGQAAQPRTRTTWRSRCRSTCSTEPLHVHDRRPGVDCETAARSSASRSTATGLLPALRVHDGDPAAGRQPRQPDPDAPGPGLPAAEIGGRAWRPSGTARPTPGWRSTSRATAGSRSTRRAAASGGPPRSRRARSVPSASRRPSRSPDAEASRIPRRRSGPGGRRPAGGRRRRPTQPADRTLRRSCSRAPARRSVLADRRRRLGARAARRGQPGDRVARRCRGRRRGSGSRPGRRRPSTSTRPRSASWCRSPSRTSGRWPTRRSRRRTRGVAPRRRAAGRRARRRRGGCGSRCCGCCSGAGRRRRRRPLTASVPRRGRRAAAELGLERAGPRPALGGLARLLVLERREVLGQVVRPQDGPAAAELHDRDARERRA